MVLEGILCDLVPYGERFLALEHRWYNDEGVFYWAMGARWIVTRPQLERWHQEDRDDPDSNRVRFGIQTKDGRPIGLFGIRSIQPYHRQGMLTALIGEPESWSGGYGTDALLLFVDYAFNWLDLRRVWLITMSPNVRVLRQMEKVGFTLEGRQREATWVNTGWADAVVYGLLRDEWPGRAALVEKLGLLSHQKE